jgi:NAD+ synthase (glutamine-hydrolysing)
MRTLRIAGAQINLTVGDIDGNVDRILSAMEWAEESDADVLLLPELAVTGYPPEDLLLRDEFITENLEAVERLASSAGDTATVVGFVDPIDGDVSEDDAVLRGLSNAAAILAGGRLCGVYHKLLLPNYGVFDEARYFTRGRDPGRVWSIAGIPAGISVCEDIWSPQGPPARQVANGARVLLNINGSPYHRGKGVERARLLAGEAHRSGVPVVYLNAVGGQDELVFDGDSMVFGAEGDLVYRAAQFAEERFVFDLAVPEGEDPVAPILVTAAGERSGPPLAPPVPAERLCEEAEIYQALVLGLRDYVAKNRFESVVVGLSGGIDSALTCAIAVDALGPEAVWGVTMPARFSSEGSVRDSEDLTRRLGCRFQEIPIDGIFGSFLEALEPAFAGTEFGVAEENLQARIRGAIIMALSNKLGSMVVATGNKSEMAVGYATLYGDMAGGYAVLKDVFKTVVYRLAEWRNRSGEVIPRATVDKAPSAELRPGQKDSDSLPDYAILDAILERYVEEDESVEDIVRDGLDESVVRKIARLVDRNEYKRRQAAPGVRITRKAFGKDRRLPITNGFGRR